MVLETRFYFHGNIFLFSSEGSLVVGHVYIDKYATAANHGILSKGHLSDSTHIPQRSLLDALCLAYTMQCKPCLRSSPQLRE
jgi:hypothetical protein